MPWNTSVLSSQFSVVGSQFSVLSCRFSVVGSQLSVLSCRFSVVGSQFSVIANSLPFWNSALAIRSSQLSGFAFGAFFLSDQCAGGDAHEQARDQPDNCVTGQDCGHSAD